MSLPFRRRPDRGSSAHERARIDAARRMDEPLAPDESAWLDRHLAECSGCRTIADAYAAQRLDLRALRETPPVPPRDLWARTAAAIEAAAGPSTRATERKRRPPLLHRLRPSPVPLGAISGVMVVVVVVGASLLSSRQPTNPLLPTGTQAAEVTDAPSRSEEPGRTPIALPQTANVSWAVAEEGELAIFSSRVDEVCATTEAPDCAHLEGDEPRTVKLPETELDSVILSPEESELVLFEAATSETGGDVLVVPAPTPPGQTPPPPTPTPSLPTTEPPTPSVPPTVPPTGSIDPSNPPDSASPTPTGSIDPNAPLAIATNVVIVGEAASYSPDGVWFAFSARPADGSQGPDIYVWQPGWSSAVAITQDHQSIFSSWVDDRILASRAVIESDGATPSPAPGESALPTAEATPTPSLAPGESPVPSVPPTARPQSFLLDPATGQETILEGIEAWLPSVDPTRRLVVFWDGTLRLDEATREWQPAEGALALARWPAVPEPPALPSGSPTVDASGLPIDPTATPSATPTPPPSLLSPPIGGSASPPPPQLEEPLAVLAAGPLVNWDARWDETGTHLAIWIEDALDRSLGRLTLHVIDADTGQLVETAEPITGLALPGFAIGNGRLVWATPGGEDGEGTKVAVVAWTDDAIGSVETQGSNQQVVIVR